MEISLEIPVIWQDEHLLVINKPAGLLTLPDGYETSKAHLQSVLASHYGKLWIVHRLDRDTSGVVVLARNEIAHRNLSIQFQERRVRKLYKALIDGDPDWNSMIVDQPLSVNRGRRNRTVVDHKNGKPSVTHVEVLRRFGSCALVSAAPETGRRHQIRAHLASQGHPVVCDRLYGREKIFPNAKNLDPFGRLASGKPLLERQALHARVLELVHPDTKQWVEYVASYPSDLQLTIETLGVRAG